MATPTRPVACHAVNTPRIGALADELRSICRAPSDGVSQPSLAAFVAGHRLTHRDVDALLVALAHDDGASSGPVVTGLAAAELDAAEDQEPMMEPGSDLAWMFGDEPESPPVRAADDLMGRAFDDLLGDWSRRGRQLARADVALLVSTRGLSPAQHGELADLLVEAGVELTDPAGPRPVRAAERGYEFHEDIVGQYLRAISRYSLIDGPREVELWSLITQGVAAQGELDGAAGETQSSDIRRSLRAQVEMGRHAFAELVCANLRLVVSIAKAKRYESCGVEFADRIQDGNLGLMRAAEKFDGSQGFKFSTYATWWIKQSIERGIGDRGSTIRVPIHFHERARQIERTASKLAARLGHRPSPAEIADALGMEQGQVQAVIDLTPSVISLDHLLGDEGDLRLSDVLVVEQERDGRTDPAEIVAHVMMREDLTSTLAAVLPAREVRILEYRFGIGTGDERTLDEIGKVFGVTRERIRQIQAGSMAMLRRSKRAVGLRGYIMDDSHGTSVGKCLEGNVQ